MDRKYSDPEVYDNSIDWDDAADGSEGGYTRHGNLITPAAMQEIVQLRQQVEEWKEGHAALDRFTVARIFELNQRIAELEAENERLREALRVILNRAYKMSPMDNVWVQGVCEAALEAGSDE